MLPKMSNYQFPRNDRGGSGGGIARGVNAIVAARPNERAVSGDGVGLAAGYGTELTGGEEIGLAASDEAGPQHCLYS